MSFEKRVLDVVARVLKNEQAAEFYSGTLFVDCSATEALQIGRKLEKIVTGGIDICAQCNGEYSFDFTL
jgi:hypothetical protein